MDAKMASWKSTGTYIDAVPSPGVNIADGMWIFRVKQPPGSPPVFKARYVAQGFSQRQGVDFFQTFSPTPKMTTLRGSLHEEIWLRRPPGFTGTTLVALGFAPSTADPSLFLPTDSSLPPFYVLVYVLQCFGFQYSSPQSTPLPTGHSLSAPPLDESVEPSGPYPELVGCLMYLMTCTRPDLAYPLSILACYVAPGRYRPEHWEVAKWVLRYLCNTSGMGLMLGGQGPVVLIGHADTSWVDDLAIQRSTTHLVDQLQVEQCTCQPTTPCRLPLVGATQVDAPHWSTSRVDLPKLAPSQSRCPCSGPCAGRPGPSTNSPTDAV
ncbi:unnamed protein product [Closterium sp. NIES-53]